MRQTFLLIWPKNINDIDQFDLSIQILHNDRLIYLLCNVLIKKVELTKGKGRSTSLTSFTITFSIRKFYSNVQHAYDMRMLHDMCVIHVHNVVNSGPGVQET